MGKTYIDTVKYMVRASLEVDGLVEKPDIVGAVFGQTEGLLGDELDLRELQKNGRIGRIEVQITPRAGKSVGSILVPSSLDMVETSILAAALEVVDRVGPCEARIAVQKIEDSRNSKRKLILDRARNLLKTLISTEIPESKELTEMIRQDVKTSEVVEYGDDKLTAGPEVAGSDSIIFVEGRADVINLLKNGVENAVAIGGANVGPSIIKLGREKEVTVFLDGDRGGDIILKELLDATDIDYIARAPVGKEVEELTRKELIQCLRRRIPLEQFEEQMRAAGVQVPARERRQARFPVREARSEQPSPIGEQFSAPREQFSAPREHDRRPVAEFPQSDSQPAERFSPSVPVEAPQLAPSASPEATAKLKAILKELEGSLKARVLDSGYNVVSEVPIREIMVSLDQIKSAHAVALDGIVTQRLVDLAEQKGAEFVAGLRAGNISRKPPSVSIVLGA